MTHENLWRQLLRWLVSGVPGPVARLGLPAARRARLAGHGRGHGERRRRYLKVNDAQVVAQVKDPSGAERDGAARMDGGQGRRIPRHASPPARRGATTCAWRRAAPGKTLGSDDRAGAGRGPGHRVLRGGDAAAAAGADRGGDGRPLLHAGRPCDALPGGRRATAAAAPPSRRRSPSGTCPRCSSPSWASLSAEWAYRKRRGLA